MNNADFVNISCKVGQGVDLQDLQGVRQLNEKKKFLHKNNSNLIMEKATHLHTINTDNYDSRKKLLDWRVHIRFIMAKKGLEKCRQLHVCSQQ